MFWLPSDLISEIIKFLDYKSIIYLRSVNKDLFFNHILYIPNLKEIFRKLSYMSFINQIYEHCLIHKMYTCLGLIDERDDFLGPETGDFLCSFNINKIDNESIEFIIQYNSAYLDDDWITSNGLRILSLEEQNNKYIYFDYNRSAVKLLRGSTALLIYELLDILYRLNVEIEEDKGDRKVLDKCLGSNCLNMIDIIEKNKEINLSTLNSNSIWYTESKDVLNDEIVYISNDIIYEISRDLRDNIKYKKFIKQFLKL